MERLSADALRFVGADLDFKRGEKKNITFSRRYLDQNRPTYEVSPSHIQLSSFIHTSIRLLIYIDTLVF